MTGLRIIVFGSVCCLATVLGGSAEAARPNVIIVLADDLGYGDPGCYNPESKIPTPHIDALAREGLRFTDAHSPSSVCTPTRYGLLTGRYAWRTRLKQGVLWPYAAPLIEPGRTTLPAMLQEHGYATGCVGKWHLGWDWPSDADLPKTGSRQPSESKIDLSQPIAGGPTAVGFDYYFGVDVPNFPPYCFIENERIVGPLPDRPKPDDMFGLPGQMQEGWKLVEILPTLEQKAVAFIEEQAAAETPFFLYLPLTAPHTPIVPAEPYRGKSEAGDYGDLVYQVDAILGSVVDAVDRLGLAENTLIVFTSDNGSPAMAGDPHWRNRQWAAHNAVVKMFDHHPSADWRGMKADIWEGGHRVPLVVRWTGITPAGETSDALVCLVDLMATAAAIIDQPLATDTAEDSYNLLPLLKGTPPDAPVRAAVVHHAHRGMFALRSGPWKAIFGLGSNGFTPPVEVEPQPGGPEGQLYHLIDDPDESENLWAEHPDVVERLRTLLHEYQRQGRSAPRTP